MKKIVVAFMAAGLLAFTACESTEPTREPAFDRNIQRQTVPENTSPGLVTDRDMDLIISSLWASYSVEDQEVMCMGFYLDEDFVLDAFVEGFGEESGRAHMRRHLNRVC